VLIPGITQHVERAGVHSGDSIAIYPAQDLTAAQIDTIVRYTVAIGRGLEVRGLFNIQFVVYGGVVHVLEVNPRASRTVPFLSKVTAIPMVDLAVRIALGERLADLPYGTGLVPAPEGFVAAKAPVFSMAKLEMVDTQLGPEMRSTGEVMGLGATAVEAIGKALDAAGMTLPPSERRAAFVMLADWDQPEAAELDALLARSGFVRSPDVTSADAAAAIRSGSFDLVVCTTPGPLGLQVRRAAVERRIPCVTTVDTARALLSSQSGRPARRVRTLDEYRLGRSLASAAGDDRVTAPRMHEAAP
jgi:carbamoyl-phosphate synthase large subunit